jgi:hypothetical protein
MSLEKPSSNWRWLSAWINSNPCTAPGIEPLRVASEGNFALHGRAAPLELRNDLIDTWAKNQKLVLPTNYAVCSWPQALTIVELSLRRATIPSRRMINSGFRRLFRGIYLEKIPLEYLPVSES